ncbi:MAG: glycosyltransferase family 4 protein [Aureliella sp.]
MIGIAHYSRAGDVGGVTTFTGDLARYLLASGREVSIFLHHFGEDPTDSEFRAEMEDSGAKVVTKPWPHFTEKGVKNTLEFINTVKPQVFIPNCIPAHFWAARTAGLAGLPWVFTFHSDDPIYWSCLEATSPDKCGGRVVSVSEFLCDEIAQRKLAASPLTIPCGVKLPAMPSRNPSASKLVYVGRLEEEQKRITLVVKTMILACERLESLTCKIIGNGPDEAKCRSLIENVGLSKRIILTGRMDSASVSTELGNADIFLMMSDYEGVPIALMEAMAHGVVPVVRRTQSGIPELVETGKTGIICSDSPDEAASAIISLTKNSGLLHKLAKNARNRISGKYRVDNCLASWDRLLKQSALSSPLKDPVPVSPRLPRPSKIGRAFDKRLPGVASRSAAIGKNFLKALLGRRIA